MKLPIHKHVIRLIIPLILTGTALANADTPIYEIWDTKEAPNREGSKEDWYSSYCIGNGYTGATLFGRVDTERVQITEKDCYTIGAGTKIGAVTALADLFIDLNHGNVSGYRRSLNLNEAIAHVRYESGGVKYTREAFLSYPDRVLALKLTADKPGALTCDIRPQIAFLDSTDKGRNPLRTANYAAETDAIAVEGTLKPFSLNYEIQMKVINQGGTLKSEAANNTGKIHVEGANSVVIIVAIGTNYRLNGDVFLNDKNKLDSKLKPHDEVTARMKAAYEKGYDALRSDHIKDHQSLFNRVSVNLNSKTSDLPTRELLEQYKNKKYDTYLEELLFQYGRYLLIASSRPNTLPANLQGAWCKDERAPWSGGYWHNINVQMNYWGAMSANLAETFEAYTDYFKAYLPKASLIADGIVERRNPAAAEKSGENGWTIGTAANAYHITAPGGHSGPGTGGLTSKLLMEYYQFTRDKTYLKEVTYPAMLGMSKFLSKALEKQEDGLLLISPSASPEQGRYKTKGCTFDQGFTWENFNDTLIAARELGATDPFLDVIKDQIGKLDPILIGESGQIKEFREETTYGTIGEATHRHISHLCTLYPGTLINSEHPEWMKAAEYSLDKRGDASTGWGMAHRMNCRARLKQGDRAHRIYQIFLSYTTLPNLWGTHPPFQIDGNFGTMAGVVEMLLQSQTGAIEPIPALPKAWETGYYNGLVARGNFVVDAKWQNSKLSHLTITSRAGEPCRIRYTGIASAKMVNEAGAVVKTTKNGNDEVSFTTEKGGRYTLAF